jgi:cyanophycinase
MRPLDGSAYIVLPPGKNWPKRVVELNDDRPGDWNQLHRSVRDRANPDYLPKDPVLPEVAKGSLVIIGGGGTPTDVLKRFIELAGGRDAQFVAFPTAMPDPINIGLESSFLKRAGVKHVAILPAREEKEVDSAENLAVLKKATGVWFGGGRQWRFVDAYEGTKTAELLRDVLRRGGVIGGSSAGATIQGDYLVRGSPFGPAAMMCEGYERGLSFLPGVAIDQHFTARNRFADMTSLMEKYPQFVGIGIDESTALIVQGHTAEIMGKGKVHFYDRRKPTEPDGPDYEVAAAGDKYDFKERKVIAGEKVLEKIAAQHPEPLPDELVKAWRNAGAEVAWMSLDRFGRLYYNYELGDKQDAVPAFGFHDWKSGAVSKLPHPSRAFGLNLHDTPLDDAGLKEVAQLEHLQALILSGTSITDAGLKELTRLKELQTLILSDTKVTDAGLNELAHIKGLKTLNISFTPLTDDGIKKLARVKTLETLVASFTQITGSGLSELAGVESLKTLDLSKTQVTDSQLKELAALKNLQMLNLLYTPVTGSGLRQLAGLKNLEILDLFGSQVSDVGLKGLPELPRLQTLILDTTQITDVGLKELARLSNLETLYLGNTKVTDSGLKELAALKKLHTLNLSFLEITGAGIKALDRLKHLKCSCLFSEAGAASFGRIC